MSVLSKEINIWKSADCVCFDVDSTVCRNEAIDDLANFIGVGDQVEKMYIYIFTRCLFNHLNHIELMYLIKVLNVNNHKLKSLQNFFL